MMSDTTFNTMSDAKSYLKSLSSTMQSFVKYSCIRVITLV